jgi:alkylation response protein AidB-like acyl-CoA dehydrogenase
MEEKIYKKGGGFLISEAPPEEMFTPEDFSEEHKMIAKTAEDFTVKEVLPKTEEIEKQNFDVQRELMRKAGELGLLGADVPEKYGGLELDKVSSMLIAEKISMQGSFTVTWGTHTGIGTLPIALFGNEEQKKKYLPKLVTGEYIGAYALTEPQAGSDAMSIQTKAVLEGDYFILNGSKQFITNAGFADVFTIFAKVDGKDFAAFIVERNTPGLIIGKEEEKMGIKGSSTCGLTLENLKVPKENLLYEIGKGHHIAFNILNIGRYKLGVGTIGASKNALKEAITYAKERVQFGRPIAEFGLIKEKIANMVTRIFMGESMAYRLAGNLDDALSELNSESPDYPKEVMKRIREYAVECSILKVYGSELLDYVVDETVQIYGGYGFVSEYPVERYYRDSRINRLFEGTNEINRLVITGMLMKNALEGKLPLLKEIDKVSKEFLTFSSSMVKIADGPVGEEKTLLSLMKKVLLLSAGIAAQTYKENLREEEELLAAISDMIIETYAFESAILRFEKLRKQGKENEIMAACIKYYAPEFMDKITKLSRKILTNCKKGDEFKLLITGLRKFSKWYSPSDIVGLSRKIADKAIEMEKYPFWVV